MKRLSNYDVTSRFASLPLRALLLISMFAVLLGGCADDDCDCNCDLDGDQETIDGDSDGDQEITDCDSNGDPDGDPDGDLSEADAAESDFETVDGESDDEMDDEGENDVKPVCFPSDATSASTIAIDSQGRWVVAGKRTPDRQHSDALLARFLSDGAPDTEFPGNGCVSLSLSLENDSAGVVVIQPDKKLLLSIGFTGGGHHGIAVLRLHDDGSLDTDFAERGRFSYTTESAADGGVGSIFVLPDGKILLVGGIDDSLGNSTVFLRLNEDGSLDDSFGDGGVVRTANPAAARAILQDDDKIVQAGYHREPGEYLKYALYRYLPDGSPDESFGEHGMAVTTGGAIGGEHLSDVVRLADGSYFAVGDSYPDDWTDVKDSAAVRFAADGTPDEDFAPGGVFVIEVGPIDIPRRIAFDAQGGIWVLGNQFSFDSSNPSFHTGYLARFTADGILDTSYADEGIRLIDIDPNGTSLSDFAFLADGNLVVVGLTGDLQSGRKILVLPIIP